MCALCGLTEWESHWADALTEADQLVTRRNRERRAMLLNRALLPTRTQIRNLSNGSMLVTSPSGRKKIVKSLHVFWSELEKLGVTLPDPLDPERWL